MIIYLHDPNSPFPKYQALDVHKSAASDVRHVFISKIMSMPQVAQAVIRMARKPSNIWLLMMLSHGNKGFVDMGTGLTQATAPHFNVLRPYMTPGGPGIEIHGCAPASDTVVADDPLVGLEGTARSSPTAGVNMLVALAKAANCDVAGAIDAQVADSSGQYNGLYVVAHPSGIYEVRKGLKKAWSMAS